MKLWAAEQAQQATAAAMAATTGATAAWLTTLKEVAIEIVGVPLPVVLAAATAAFGALSFVSGLSYKKTMGIGFAWTLAGAYGAQLGLFLLAAALEWALSRHVDVPTGLLGGAALVIAGAGPVLVTTSNVEKARAAFGRWLDGLGGPK